MMSWRGFYHNKWTRVVFWSVLYLLWVIWLGNYWWLFGLLVIFDHHITQKVRWLFWKKEYKEGEKKNAILEWVDAIIFAVVVVTFINIFFFQAFKIPSSSMESSLMTGDHLFVSKLAYGPRLPQTPLTIPFTHNILPNGKESYSTLIQNKYRRLKGFGCVERGDYVVFGFPDGDTVLTKAPAEDYYTLCRLMEKELGVEKGREYIRSNYGPIKARPMDKKDHYVKRCVAVPGDTLCIIDGVVFVNSAPLEIYPGIQNSYRVIVEGKKINGVNLEKAGLNVEELWFDESLPGYPSMPLTAEMLERIKSLPNVVSVEPNVDVYPPDAPDSYLTIFPFSENFEWTRDNFGPIWIPKKGVTVELNAMNLPLYRRIITTYEGNELNFDEESESITINGQPATSYTFLQDYYFMMGDNRHNSLDSRYWGFVPEDHIVGKPSLIWLSTDRGKSFPRNIRWNRFFRFV